MSRTVNEWQGKNDDTTIPPRVKVRIFERDKGCCQSCGILVVGGVRPAFDHVVALINGGENREANLQLLCVPCHAVKTKADVAEKSTVARKRQKHLGVRKPSRFPGSRDSGWKKKISGEVVRR